MWETWVAVAVATLGLGAQVKDPVYSVFDIQEASASQSADSAISGKIDIERAERISADNDIRDMISDTRQMTACSLWHIPAERCGDFKIPVDFNAK